ncbi:hypothetical protein B0H65DRAFT_264378 [Neurospora tetraspora]|uniref:Uncharacterized protein n=1 Tax=Neurospora tetraspora TaxID=94610 RepID=A0AAE0JB35_9PEZI|nr:hypothetical protein B0H65DRAFT_264378 [Neurospora tetraspora]
MFSSNILVTFGFTSVRLEIFSCLYIADEVLNTLSHQAPTTSLVHICLLFQPPTPNLFIHLAALIHCCQPHITMITCHPSSILHLVYSTHPSIQPWQPTQHSSAPPISSLTPRSLGGRPPPFPVLQPPFPSVSVLSPDPRSTGAPPVSTNQPDPDLALLISTSPGPGPMSARKKEFLRAPADAKTKTNTVWIQQEEKRLSQPCRFR